MPKFRKKPIVIEAEQFNEGGPNGLPFQKDSVCCFLPENYWAVYDELHKTWIRFEEGDWIIKGMKGEYYPCQREVFEETYEPV